MLRLPPPPTPSIPSPSSWPPSCPVTSSSSPAPISVRVVHPFPFEAVSQPILPHSLFLDVDWVGVAGGWCGARKNATYLCTVAPPISPPPEPSSPLALRRSARALTAVFAPTVPVAGRPAGGTFGGGGGEKVATSLLLARIALLRALCTPRSVHVSLAQGPCSSSLYRSVFSSWHPKGIRHGV